VEIFSDNTAEADSIRKIEELRKMAFLDHLTQLPNRRFIEISLDTALNEFRKHKSTFGVMSLDLDRLKEINDTYGHAVGDSVLKETASTLKASFRSSDVVGRWGGDEFIAIVHGAGSELLNLLARRCASLVSKTSIPLPGGGKLSPAVSVGTALIEGETSVEELLRLCDERLYRSKRESRNRATAA
jgi:diguanylate cyclase (GGDEF)-like protein